MNKAIAGDLHFASRVARQAVRWVVAFAMVFICALLGERFLLQKSLITSWTELHSTANLRASILLHDEQKTMSALAYALSSTPFWKTRYQEVTLKFDAAVKQAKLSAGPGLSAQFDRDVMEAGQILLDMETLVLDLTDNNESADATNVFTSPRYTKNKAAVEAGINDLLTSMEQRAQSELASTLLRASVLSILALAISAISFFWLSRRLKSALGKATTAFEDSQVAYLQQLAANHEASLNTTRLEQVGTLTATIAHEMRNPLGAVRTSAFMLNRLWLNPDERIARLFSRINAGIDRCDALITQLLEFSQLGPSEKVTVEFDDWLEVAAQDLAKTLDATISLICELGANGVKVDMDKAQMHRALGKLLANASEAMIARNGVKDTVACENPEIRVSSRRSAQGLTLSIQDNGHGIAEDILMRVTDPFFTTKNFGAGLGLPTVKRIVEQHLGEMEIESVVKAGSTVRIMLPAA